MPFSKTTRFKLTAGILGLALCLGGSAYGSTSTSRHTHHAAVQRQSARHGSLHRASYRHGRGRHARRHSVNLGQRAMDSQRATEIQQALISAHYLNGSPTGQWDADSQTAMQKYQVDNGWQSKITPDSRAIIKLGLGPKQDDGEYSSTPTGISNLSGAPSTDAIRSLATSEMPAGSQD